MSSSQNISCIWRFGCTQISACEAAGCCQSLAGNREKTDYGLTPKLAAVQMALNAFDGNEAQTVEEILETLRAESR